MVLTPVGASLRICVGEPTFLTLPSSISTAPGERAFPVRGSSNRPAFTRITTVGDWAASCPIGNSAKYNGANSMNSLRIRLTTPLRNNPLILSVTILHRIEQLIDVISDAVLEDNGDVFDIRDASGWIALHNHQIRVLSGRNRTDVILATEKDGTVQCCDPNRLYRREPGI